MPNKKREMIIGIDQSYDQTGIGISVNGKCVAAKVLDMNKDWFHINDKPINNNTVKRRLLKNELRKIFKKYKTDYKITVIFERIRTFSGSHISTNYIIVTGALIAVIIDACFEDFIEAYSVDTRSWKKQITGSAKSGTKTNTKGKEVPDKKGPTLKWVNSQVGKKINPNVLKEYGGENGKITNDNLADAICISLYGFVSENNKKLKLETPEWGFENDKKAE